MKASRKEHVIRVARGSAGTFLGWGLVQSGVVKNLPAIETCLIGLAVCIVVEVALSIDW